MIDKKHSSVQANVIIVLGIIDVMICLVPAIPFKQKATNISIDELHTH